ncbi:MAG TPA: polysaccharide biosynthesis/export family protein [Candidatus Limnocylindria bacterium]|jgi:polysaccharide export outer membrane protein|nr:polysaccharide biosynthesis/export family protein [Candidatus Limnocylindria bacterium]
MKMRIWIRLLWLMLLSPALLRADDGVRKIVPGDTLSIRVNAEPELTMPRTVNSDGKINYWLLGDIEVKDKTLGEVEKIIREMLDKDYIINPSVSVEMQTFSKLMINVIGEVQRPSRYDLPTDRRIDILDAIALAGGYSPKANKDKIILKRKNKTITYSKKDLDKLREEGNSIRVEPDDEIEVKMGIL